MDYYKTEPSEFIFIIYDDISPEPGQIRIKYARKGAASATAAIKRERPAHLGTQEFPRIRIGVGEKPARYVDLCSGTFSKEKWHCMNGTASRR